MKVGLLTYNLTSVKSGKSRFLINIAKGLSNLHHRPVVFSLYMQPDVASLLSSLNVELHYSRRQTSKFYQFKGLTYSDGLAEKMARLVKGEEDCDFYVVIGDEVIPVIKYMDGKRVIYISNGDWTLLHLIKEFNGIEGVISRVLSKNFVSTIKKHSSIMKNFDLVLANSRFTANLMSFLYGIPINGVVYPPVDLDFFHPNKDNKCESPPYALAMSRNDSDPIHHIVESIAKNVRTKVVGGDQINNAENLGFVTDEELVSLYSNAFMTLSPNVQEFYGYTIVESMSCGTPVLTYDNAGASEMIRDTYNGWFVRQESDINKTIMGLMETEEHHEMRENCLKESIKYGIQSSTTSLLSFLRSL